ncbi:ABC transporter permease [Gorillibacterium sp. CAU 1737]|uniref:ABC transporter permease n=1 Tax=Gorillibacterium sp. CAU 1737 TaxID=3140362 RepID=UPI00325FDFAB
MFGHIMLTRMKCLLRDRQLMFWTLFFPLILGTFFQMAFSNLDKTESFKPIAAAVIENDAYKNNSFFRQLMDTVSEGDSRIFNLTRTVTAEEANQLLEAGDIVGYYTADGNQVSLTVKSSGINQSIMKSFADQYLQTSSAVEEIIQTNPQALQNGILSKLSDELDLMKEVPIGSAPLSLSVNYFYTLIAMACFYGSFLGLKEVTDIQADLSNCAMRVNMSPVHKFKAFLAGMTGALIIHFAEILILLAYVTQILKVDFGSKTGYVLATAFLGCVLGLSFGSLISAAFKKNENTKTAILLTSIMIGSFLAGMMAMNMKYQVMKYMPILSYLNPVNLLTDALYSLYYYDTLDRYLLNMGLMGAFAAVFCLGTYLIIRRRKYASL